MQTPIITPQTNPIELLPSDIRELLFINVTIPISTIKRIADRFVSNPSTDIQKLKKILSNNLVAKSEAAIGNPVYQEKLCTKAKTHIAEWNKEFGQVHLKEVLKISQSLNIPAPGILERSLINPISIEEALKEYVIGQDEYVSKLSLSFYTHYLRSYYPDEFINLPQAPILAFGPTGSGKTYAVQVLSKLFNIPFGIANCNSLVPEGIVGQSFSSVFTEIYKNNNKDISRIEKSMILIDEVDKIKDNTINELLSITDDNGQILFNDTHGNRSYDSIQISTRGIMFVFTGVFDDLRRPVEKRLNINTVGFSTSPNTKKDFCFYEHVILDDFKSVNLKPEILGRIRDAVYVKEHTEETIAAILMNSVESPLLSYKNYFEQHGISLSFDTEGAKAIAELAIEKHLGARGLKTMLWKLLSKEMTNVTKKRNIIINREYVKKIINYGTAI